MKQKLPSKAESADFKAFSGIKGLSELSLKGNLGRGSFGSVSLATLPSGSARCAVKQMPKRLFVKKSHLEQVLHERDLLSEIDHPFIVSLYATFQDKTNLYLVMEFVQGGELFGYLKSRKNPSEEHARFYGGQVATAFEFLHSKEIVYRDLKPENLMISPDGYLKLIDFSFAKRLPNGRRTYTFCGTPEYLAPEIIRSTGHSFGADWWTLGIFVFELTVGEPPFDNNTSNVLDLYKKILRGHILFPRSVAPATRQFVKKLCEIDITKRLGCTKLRANGVKQHRYFSGFEWDAQVKKISTAPFVPTFASPYDLTYFEGGQQGDAEAEAIKIDDSTTETEVIEWPDDHFEGW